MLFCTVLLLVFGNSGSFKVEIDVNRGDDHLPHFWKSTGLSPPDPKSDVYKFLLSDDERANIALIGALPHTGIEQIRIHWLINLIRYENGKYNFEYLDELLDWLYLNRLRPGFEIMGMPINIQTKEVTNIYEFWFDLVREIAIRYIGRFGMREVKNWRFETWNEPDLKMYNTNNFTLEEYITYVSACTKGLQSAVDSNMNKSITTLAAAVSDADVGGSAVPTLLKIGGPAGLFKRRDKHPLCWGLLEMCNSILDTLCPLQYISFHKKGDGSASRILSEDLELLDRIHSEYPNVKGIPIANDEADILTNWSKDEEWRGDARYAAMVVKVIADHYKEIVLKRKVKIEVLSNDNAFLNYHPYYFTQRTLLARFQMNNTTPRHVQFVKKPVYAVMGLLSVLGEQYIKEKIYSSDPLITVLAARSRYEGIFSALIAYVNDTQKGDDKNRTAINIAFENLPQSDCKYAIYVLDNQDSNPFLLWKASGSPVFPGKELLAQMRSVQEPHRLKGPSRTFSRTRLELNLNLTLPSVALVHICSPNSAAAAPGRVTHLHATNVTRNEVLLIWKDNKVHSKCIRTYEVEFQGVCGQAGKFERINGNDTIFLSYHHVGTGNVTCDAAQGRYRVRAIDYFDQGGRYSKVINYPEGL